METKQMMQERNQTVKILRYAAETLNKISSISDELQNVKGKYKPTEGGYKQMWHGIKPIGKKLLLVFIGFMVAGSFNEMFNQIAISLYSTIGFSVNMSIIIMCIMQGILIILFPVIGQLLANKINTKKNQENADRLESNRQYNENVVYPQEQRVLEKLRAARNNYSQVSVYLPSQYKYNSDALYFMASAIDQGRADTVGQSINLYEEDQHRRKVENKLDEQNRLREAQLAATFAEIDAINNMNRRAANGYY